MIINATVQGSTNWTYKSGSIYTLVNNNFTDDYTLCEIRSWLSTNCSTHLNISGTTGAHMSANCEDESDPVSYRKSVPDAVESDEADWKWLADAWQLAIYMNSGLTTLNASRDRILTALPLEDPLLPLKTPSLAEVLAALVSPTLISGSIKTPTVNYWPPEAINATLPGMPGWEHEFNASITKQEYTSGAAQEYQRAFLVILILGFLLNLFCLVHLFIQLRGRPLTDFTDPANLFALAINSPPSCQLSGSCGGGPKGTQLDVPWRIGYSEQSNHYFFEEATEKRQRLKRRSRRDVVTSEMELVDFKDGDTKAKMDNPRQSYIKLSNHKSWL